MKRLLIANRGEIVLRIIATCRRLGIETVTVYAADDVELPHATAGDFGCLLEGETLRETYLNIDQLIAVAKRAGADAVHPGYGFLSENAKFAESVTKAGLIFVGPSAEAIARMGDKAESRKLCESIGVPVIPGYHGGSADIAILTKEAARIGYPVLVKAAAGGGGKGMRVVQSEKELEAAWKSASSEAQAAFGDGRLLLEKYLQEPRHIEVQVFSDTKGNHLHLYERECSIQRRHQKIVEESPACNLPEATRARMFESATKLAKHIGYVGAGTVEFILDQSGEFYFLEMNTRLQVEHPVTELVTGLDLVQLQLEVAQGKELPMKQQQVAQQGHAIEVRLYAEDPEKEFLPSPGTLNQFSLPHIPGLRCENGYAPGAKISGRYDPMIAKIAAGGKTREDAIETLLQGLEETQLSGVASNLAFLMRVLDSKPFRDGKTTTNFIPMYRAQLFAEAPQDITAAMAAAYLLGSGVSVAIASEGREYSAWASLGNKQLP